MSKLKEFITNPRIIILIIFLVLSLVAIHPNPFASGAAIRSVDTGSSASIAGIESPDSDISPMAREVIIALNDFIITDSDDYYTALNEVLINQTFTLETNKETYRLEKSEDMGITVYDAPTNNLRKGLDLQGGTRVLLKPERELTDEEVELVIDVLKERLNVFGLSDIIVREAKDLSGDEYIIVEIAGANEKEIQELIAKQGKFEARIGNETVFTGGNDITYICKSTTCSGINPKAGCSQIDGSWICQFSFAITLSPEAAQRQADVTQSLDIVTNENSNQYLSEKLELYLDDELVDELNIAPSLKGRAVTDISITGSGNGTTKELAMDNTFENMKTLQTVLQTGSLPVKMEIVKTDSLSPLMGEQFTQNSLKVGLLALLTVAIIVFIRYRRIQITIPMILSMLSEVVIILGAAALIKWNLDLVAIAGIIVAVGTGVDDLIVMNDESLSKDNESLSWSEKRKNAFFIIMAAYFTTVVAMLPLIFAGAGLLRGFALTTILGITAGVFIVRPAFAATLKILLKEY